MGSERFGMDIEIYWRMKNCMPNQSLQATPTNASVSSLKLMAGLCHRYGVPELYRSAAFVHL
jgi:hypothetical protein